MVTLVGTEDKINEAIAGLVELEYDVINSFKFAINKIISIECRKKFAKFLEIHVQRIEKIRSLYNGQSSCLPEEGNKMKSAINKLKIILGSVKGEQLSILKAVLENVTDAAIAYERVLNHPYLPRALNVVIWQAFEEEKKCKSWLEYTIQNSR